MREFVAQLFYPLCYMRTLKFHALFGTFAIALICFSDSVAPPLAWGRSQAVQLWQQVGPHYDVPRLCQIAAPPAVGSVESSRDFEILLSWQEKRTSAEVDRAGSEARISLEAFFGPAYGPLSDKEVAVPGLRVLFEKVQWTADIMADEQKKRWGRPRPFVTDPRIHPTIQVSEKSFAYPSGHATVAATASRVLARLFPDRSAALVARGDQIALDRVIGGVHHPSDIEAGKDCGAQVADILLGNAAFISDFENARKALHSGN